MLAFDPPHLLYPAPSGTPTWCLTGPGVLERVPLRRVPVGEALPRLLEPTADPAAATTPSV
ncbi:hypothetical protein GCM10027589_59790 [Actinocorallia lasiicapitis]